VTGALATFVALRARGVEFAVTGDSLRYRPSGAVTEAERDALRAHRRALLALLADLATLEQDGTASRLRTLWGGLAEADRVQLRSEADAGDRSAGLILAAVATSPEPAAWLLYSHRLGLELWLVRDAAALELIRDELAGRPVVMADELPALRRLDTDALRAVLDAKATFPGAGLVPSVPEVPESSQ